MTDIKKLQDKLEQIRQTSSRGEAAMVTQQDLKEVCEIILGESLDKPKALSVGDRIIMSLKEKNGFSSWWNKVEDSLQDRIITELNTIIRHFHTIL